MSECTKKEQGVVQENEEDKRLVGCSIKSTYKFQYQQYKYIQAHTD